MANYGLQATPGSIPFTGYSPTLGVGAATDAATVGAVYANGLTQADADIARILRNGGATAAVRQLLYTLLGAVAGTTAVKTKARVAASQFGAGSSGAVAVETINLVNRATTAADLAAFQALLNRTVFPATYAADLSKNGGGGKGAW